MSDFETWWQEFPRKVGKLAAEREFSKARKRASLEDLIDGVARYRNHKPSYADWCHPVTWLRQGRWLDEDDTPAVAATLDYVWPCPHPGAFHSQTVCRNQQIVERARAEKVSIG